MYVYMCGMWHMPVGWERLFGFMKPVSLAYSLPHKGVASDCGGCSAEAVLVRTGLRRAGRLQLGVESTAGGGKHKVGRSQLLGPTYKGTNRRTPSPPSRA